MIVLIFYTKSGDRFEDVMTKKGGILINDKEEAIRETEWLFENEPNIQSLQLVYIDSDEDNINLFYEMEERDGGYSDFWSKER